MGLTLVSRGSCLSHGVSYCLLPACKPLCKRSCFVYTCLPTTLSLFVQDFHSGKTPLHLAVEKCSLTDVQFLTETCQVDVNKATYSGCTALHTAAGRGNIAVVAYLLSMGADPDLLTDEGDTALDLAGSDQVATILTKAATLRWLSA